jgi:hypothetical protein
MWSAHAVIYYTAPVVVTVGGVYLLYRATQVEGAAGDRAFILGLIFVFAAWGFTAARTSRRRSKWRTQLENENQYLCQQVRDLQREVVEVRRTLESKIAAEVFLAAMERADEHRGKSWVHFHHAD